MEETGKTKKREGRVGEKKDKQADTHTQTERERETERQRDRERERDREKERKREKRNLNFCTFQKNKKHTQSIWLSGESIITRPPASLLIVLNRRSRSPERG